MLAVSSENAERIIECTVSHLDAYTVLSGQHAVKGRVTNN